MPTLYSYATNEVEGTIFDNIQRRIAHTENASSYRMSEYPPKDITDGKADKFIEVLTEDLYTLTNSVDAYTDMLKIDRDLLTYETHKADNYSTLKSNIKGNIRGVALIEKDIEKYERKLKVLKESIPYVSLTNFLDFRTAYDTMIASFIELIQVGNDLIRFLREDGLIKTKGYAEVRIDPEGFNEEGAKPLYRRKITDKNLIDKMKEIARRPDYIMEENPYNDDEINDRNRVDLINLALQELGEIDFIYDPTDTSYKDPEYTLFYNKLNKIKDARKLGLELDRIKKRKIIERKKLERDRLIKEEFDREYEDYRNRTEDYVPFEPKGVSYDEEGNVAFEPEEEEEEEEEEELPDEDILDRNIAIREEGVREILEEERELFRGLKLMNDLVKKINEPFARVWEKLTRTMISIEEDMKDILNNFNEFRQQTLHDPNTITEEKEALLNNPYGTKRGGNFTKRGGGYWEEMAKGTYKDGKYTPNFDTRVSMKGGAEMAKYDDTRAMKYDNNIYNAYTGGMPRDESRMGIYDNSRMGVADNSRMGVYNAYSGGMPPQLSHPSSREMARYYGSGGSKYI
jgi:hypothetical protein